MSSSVFLSLEMAPVSPFIVEGGTGVIHVFCYAASLMHWSNTPVTPDLVRRGSSSDSMALGMADHVPVTVR